MSWPSHALGEFALRGGGSIDPSKFTEEVFDLYSIPAYDLREPEVVRGSEIGSAKKLVQQNDVMISRIVPHIRRSWVVSESNGHRQIASGEWIVFRDKRIWPQYLRQFLLSDIFHSQFMRTVSGVGGSLLRAKPAQVYEIKLPLPPLVEQKRIAGILHAADALRAKRRESLAQLDTLMHATFLDMFGDPVANPMGWEKRNIGEIVTTKPNNGIFRMNSEYSEDPNASLPVVWVGELFCGNVIDSTKSRRLVATPNEVEKYGLRYGDVLFCRSSLKLDGIAFNNVYLGENYAALFECHLIRISPDTAVVNPMFLNFQLRTDPMRAVLKGKSKTATMTTIDQKAITSVEVTVPPMIQQRRFTSVLQSVEQQKGRMQAHFTELDALFVSLQSRAFNGKL